MKTNRSILIRPLITEKISNLQDAQRKVAFVVYPEANKIEIRQAIEATLQGEGGEGGDGQFHRQDEEDGQVSGRRRTDFKKAVVTLREGSKIEYVEGK